MSYKEIRTEVLENVVTDMQATFTTRDVSEDARMRGAHPELTSHIHYHAFVGRALSEHRALLNISEIQKATSRGSRWERHGSFVGTARKAAQGPLGAGISSGRVTNTPDPQPHGDKPFTARNEKTLIGDIREEKDMELGPQYKPDDRFKAQARLFQSRYRATVLKVPFHEFGNRLTDSDAEALLNYYGKLSCRESLRNRYPSYSHDRDADMLRSEHIPFNLFAPLDTNREAAVSIIGQAFNMQYIDIESVKLEYAPKPKESYLSDGTSFDTYIEATTANGQKCGIGIEVKYTEHEYKLKKGSSEEDKVLDHQSPYWKTARASGCFKNPDDQVFGTDPLRQIWRNHLLGLSMVERDDIDEFYSITLFPNGNDHFPDVIPQYTSLLKDEAQSHVFGCTFDRFISSIGGTPDFDKWRDWLEQRYIITQ